MANRKTHGKADRRRIRRKERPLTSQATRDEDVHCLSDNNDVSGTSQFLTDSSSEYDTDLDDYGNKSILLIFHS